LTETKSSSQEGQTFPDGQNEENQVESGDFTAEKIEKLLNHTEKLPSQVEPDAGVLTVEVDEAEKLSKPVTSEDILVAQKVMAELGDDPVRLYLKDIGTIELLDVRPTPVFSVPFSQKWKLHGSGLERMSADFNFPARIYSKLSRKRRPSAGFGKDRCRPI